MKESVTYQAIVEEGRQEGRQQGRQEGRQEGQQEGRADEARRLLLRLGTLRFGTPSEQAQTTLMMVPSVDKLEELSDRLLSAESWDELLQGL